MKSIILLSMVIMSAAYDDIKDSVYDTMLKDKTMQRAFFSCLVDATPCDDFGNQVKSHAKEIMKDGCKECDTVQKHSAHLLIQAIKNDFPDLYVLFEAKYDPDLNLMPKLDDAVKNN